ncbi:M48 family metalloprotease [Cesiribacter andamanensis]|uniref:Peptidase family M48 n=1 Tax=Cesiribacter andamanensis AMV16 TaxID=1279009 RepID=M7N2N1_9BACT|nr:M48 family metalloprotease [Cesiribacter andamanensis]EMR01557.1 Peptidase family M48 [Cesiribacter andamanensis AMV16]
MIQVLAYHQKVFDYFKSQPKTWDFFAAAKTKEEQLAEYKTELLKNTYKFNAENDPLIFDLLQQAKEKLDLQALSVQIYQAQNSEEINASIIYLHQEAHIVLSGSIRQLLGEQELLAVLAHELTHVKLYTLLEGQIEVADRIITAIANNYNSEPAYYETARLFKLYTEIFCDRGAYIVLGETGPVITSLIKTATGLQQVSAESYLQQADEIFSADASTRATAFSHPENFIRARAIQLWHLQKEAAEPEIIRMIEGVCTIDQLDLFKQQELLKLTKEFLDLYLKPAWFRSSLVNSHAGQFFANFSRNEEAVLTTAFRDKIETAHSSVKDYFGYLMLDFALLDPDLEEVPFGWAYQFSEDLALKEVFDVLVKKELKLSDKKLQQHKMSALAAFQGVKEGEGEQVYEG